MDCGKQAFLKAWENVCEANGEGIPTPDSTFLLNPIVFQGPCKSNNVQVQTTGTIVAPDYMGAWGEQKSSWFTFAGVNGLTVDGGGTIDGQGSIWWDYCKRDPSCDRPTASYFHGCNGLRLTDLKHLNSQRNHVTINGCTGVLLSRLQIEAPSDSPNTDGVDISASSNITIINSSIGTGDDCVAINGQTSYVNVAGVQCGPGHGISVGSLGRNGAFDPVEEVHVRNCTSHQTSNGLRIKTWQGWTGYASNISFEDIKIVESKNPIIIDQHYSNFLYASPQQNSSQIGITNITYRNINGSSAQQVPSTRSSDYASVSSRIP